MLSLEIAVQSEAAVFEKFGPVGDDVPKPELRRHETHRYA